MGEAVVLGVSVRELSVTVRRVRNGIVVHWGTVICSLHFYENDCDSKG